MAYKTTRGEDPTDDLDAAFVELDEFHNFIIATRRYIELYAAFEDIDEGEDHRIDFSEFSAGLQLLAQWGVTVENAEEEFQKIDENGGGQILFEEFCSWALQR